MKTKHCKKISQFVVLGLIFIGYWSFSLFGLNSQFNEKIEKNILSPQQETDNHLDNTKKKLDRLQDATLKGNIPQDQYHALLRAVIEDVNSARAANKRGLDNSASLLADETPKGKASVAADAKKTPSGDIIENQVLPHLQETGNHLKNAKKKLDRLQDATLKGNIPQDQYHALLRAVIEDVDSARAANKRGLDNSASLLVDETPKKKASVAADTKKTPSGETVDRLIKPQLQETGNHLHNLGKKLEKIQATAQSGSIQHDQLVALIRAAASDLEKAQAANDQGLKNSDGLLAADQADASTKGYAKSKTLNQNVKSRQQSTQNHMQNLRKKLDRLLDGVLKKNMNQNQLNSLARAAMSDLENARSANNSALENLEAVKKGH